MWGFSFLLNPRPSIPKLKAQITSTSELQAFFPVTLAALGQSPPCDEGEEQQAQVTEAFAALRNLDIGVSAVCIGVEGSGCRLRVRV